MASSTKAPLPKTFSDLPQEIRDKVYGYHLSLPYTDKCPTIIWALSSSPSEFPEVIRLLGTNHTILLSSPNTYSAGTMSQQYLDVLQKVQITYIDLPISLHDENSRRYRFFTDLDHRQNNPKGCRNDTIVDQLGWFKKLRILTVDVRELEETNEWLSMIKLYMRTTTEAYDGGGKPSLRTIRLLISFPEHVSGTVAGGSVAAPVANMGPRANAAFRGTSRAAIGLLDRWCRVGGVSVSGRRGGDEEWVWELEEGWWMMTRPWGVF